MGGEWVYGEFTRGLACGGVGVFELAIVEGGVEVFGFGGRAIAGEGNVYFGIFVNIAFGLFSGDNDNSDGGDDDDDDDDGGIRFG